jgi:hypothetical protein
MRKRLVLFFLVILTFAIFLAAQKTESKEKSNNSREALVIGNSDYESIKFKLEYAKKDARNIANALERLGFKVIFVPDATKKEFYDKLRKWELALKRSGGVALFYYTGHGMQTNGINYLIPIDADISQENEIVDQGVKADLVLQKMIDAQCETNIIVFDSCRANPSHKVKIYEEGFAKMQAWPGAIIAYSTIPGRTARDSESYSSFFYYQLLYNPHLEIRDIFKNVRNFVINNTGGKQLPYETDLLGHEFHFKITGKQPGSGLSPGLSPIKGKTKLRSDCLEQKEQWVKVSILKNKFFDLCWHPDKGFNNKFKRLKRKKTIVIIDEATDLMWFQSGSKPMTHKDAYTWLDKLNEDEIPASYSDWRFPTIEEAASLLEENKTKGLFIDSKFSPLQKKIWTCDRAPTEIVNDEILIVYWAVDFKKGTVARFDQEELLSLRPVRSIR